MGCNCTATVDIPYNAENIIVGTYNGDPNTTLLVCLATATGRNEVIECIADGDGVIKIDNPQLRMNTPYTLFITKQDDEEQENQGFTISDKTYTCIQVQFVPVNQDSGNFSPTNFKLSV